MSSTVAPDTIARRLAEVRVVPVTSFETADQAQATGAALLRGGISCIEVTFRTTAAARAIAEARELDGLLVGAGTLLSAEQVREAVDAGAQFGVAPGTNLSVIEAARDLGLPFFPGVATPSEIERARSLGAEIMKVFPAGPVGGPPFLKAVAAVYPDVKFIPTGGVDASTVADYLAVPSVLAVGGSWIAPANLIHEGRYDEIERLARGARKRAS
jgi:2-dehydro-3-deoxyphosphogluconate aldolase / (4S)-4-hydroxy-2-oxoglutarate aldolase